MRFPVCSQCVARLFKIVQLVLYRLLQRSDSNVKREDFESLQFFGQILSVEIY